MSDIKIPLVKDSLNKDDFDSLIEWLKTYPKISQGELVKKFEEEFSKQQGRKYSVFVNSGSSANLAMLTYYKLSNNLKNNRIILSGLSWSTTVGACILLGFTPYLCDVDPNNLGMSVTHLKELVEKYDPGIILCTNILGFPNDYKEILDICNSKGIILLEDDCESANSEYDNKKTGNFGEVSTKSFFISHYMSCGEGGMISCDDPVIYNFLKGIRAHSWIRDMDKDFGDWLKAQYNIDDFQSLYSFFYPSYNIRNTEIAANLALSQLKRLDYFCKKRKENFEFFQKNIINDYWKPKPTGTWISNFCYPIIYPDRKKLVEHLTVNGIASRPLVGGDISQSPLWQEWGTGKVRLEFCDKIHKEGIYIPNNPDLTQEELDFIVKIVNEVTSI